MNLTIENLGSIKKGEVNLDKNLIILTGPNNTGKSYFTYLLHAIHNYNSFITDLDIPYDIVFSHLQKSTFIHDTLQKHNKISLEDIVSNHKEIFPDLIIKLVKDNLVKIFASSKIKPKVAISIDNLKIYDRVASDVVTGFNIIEDNIHPFHKDEIPDKYPPDAFTKHKLNLSTLTITYSAVLIARQLEQQNYFGKSYMFPAERTAINLFARDIVSKKAGSRDDIAVRVLAGEDLEKIAISLKDAQNLNPKYPLALNDYINFVNSFAGAENATEYNDIAEGFESLVMGGAISLSEFKQPLFQPKGTKQSLGLHESSSLIKSLSFLVLYLRYSAKKGDWVVIDEPEINLHPNLQVIIARLFAKMVNSGLKLVLSTHSDYLIKELNTLVLLHELSKDKEQLPFIKKSGYTNDYLLDKQHIGAYFLNKGTINQINVIENGIVVPSIDRTIADIDNFSEEILYKLSKAKTIKSSKRTKSHEPK